jgi:ferritin
MERALNDQLQAELYSAYLYLSMSAYFHDEGLPGFANWMAVQNQEETFHGMKFFDYICERGGRVKLQPIEGPPVAWESAKAVFAQTLEHERKVTGLIHGLVDLAAELKDHATSNFLQWFIGEQVEEEASAEDILKKVERCGEGAGLMMLDKDLGARVFTPPAAE